MADTNEKKTRGLKARAAIAAGILTFALCPAVALAAGNAPQQMGQMSGQNGMPPAREQVVVQDRMDRSQGEMPADGEEPPALPDGQMPVEGQQPPALPNGEQPVEGEEPPALPDGQMPVEGQQPPALPNGEQPVEGEEPPALPENVAPMGQQSTDDAQQPTFDRELTPVQTFIKEFYSFFERLLGMAK